MNEVGREHKVLLVLDQGSLLSQRSGEKITVSLKESSSSETKEIASTEKTLWTWLIECTIEFHRITGDLFHDSSNLLRILIAKEKCKYLARWGEELFSSRDLFQYLYDIDHPKESDPSKSYLISGFKNALQGISELTEHQKKLQQQAMEKELKKLIITQIDETNIHKDSAVSVMKNVGSIVLFTCFESQKDLDKFVEMMPGMVSEENESLQSSQNSKNQKIDHVFVAVVNIYPKNKKVELSTHSFKEIDPLVSLTVINSEADALVISAAHGACIEIYDLISTTVSGIPMKEEAQKGQSVNYDVELLHSKAAHEQLEKFGLVGQNGFLKDPGCSYYPTFKLAWATPSPRQAWNLLPRTKCPYAITPCSVNSRPSVCLTSFLLNGRTVMLEVVRKGPAQDFKPNVGQKLISHTLVSHAGRLYIHSIDIEKIAAIDEPSNDLDEILSIPDSITEWKDETSDAEADVEAMDQDDKQIGRASSDSVEKFEEDFDMTGNSDSEDDQFVNSAYCMVDRYYDVIGESSTLRVDEMCQMIKTHMLRPPKSDEALPASKLPCYQPMRNLRRATRFWPLNVEGSIIFNVQKTTKLPAICSTYQKAALTLDDIQELKKNLSQLIELRDREVELVEQSWKTSTKRNLSPAEQYRELLSDLSLFMSNSVNNSVNHLEIFDFFMNLAKSDGIKVTSDDVSLNDLKDTAHVVDVKRQSEQNSDVSPPLAKKQRLPWKQNETLRISEWLNTQNAQRFKAHSKEFEARVEFGHRPAQLYKNLDLSTAAPRGEPNRS
ncbi:unnamed protein product [Auanema sp. JU1783]|nr:unnamed protein product [Auanema sp. JU1783]